MNVNACDFKYVFETSPLLIYGTDFSSQYSKIESNSKKTKIYPLPHMYVVKDLVPDMNHFYEQYRSIQPWLQRGDEDKLGDGSSQLLQSTTDRAKLVRLLLSCCVVLFCIQHSCASRMACTSASCARAAPPRARRTGGTRTSISDPRFSCRLTGG